MAKYKENKVVDYGGTALGVGSLLLCGIFYPAVVAASCFSVEGEYCTITQLVVFVVVAGFLAGVCAGIKEMETRAERVVGYIFLLLIYVPTFMPFIRILKDIYN